MPAQTFRDDDDDVFTLDLTLEQARDLPTEVEEDGDAPIEMIYTLIDEAQAYVHMGRGDTAYAVIRIKR